MASCRVKVPQQRAIELFLALEGATTKRAPWTQGHAFCFAHRQDISFEVARRSAPEALVDTELRQAMMPGVCEMSVGIAGLIITSLLVANLTFIALDNHPGRGVADAEI